MKTYRERTQAVIEKVDEYNKTQEQTVDNGGSTLSIRRNKKILLWSLFAAACIALIISLNLWLFLPFPTTVRDISAYKDSEYYGLISVINEITSPKPAYKNNFEKLTASLNPSGGDKITEFATPNGADAPAAPSNPGVNAPDGSAGGNKYESSGNGNYQETTNNQVAGVIEGDLLKRSDKYAFYLLPRHYNGLELRVYSLNGENAPFVNSYTIVPSNPSYYDNNCEIYLSEDCNTLTVITQTYDRNSAYLYTCAVSLDVSNVKDIKERARLHISGAYISSRLNNGNLLLMTNYYTNSIPDFSDEAQFLPRAGKPYDMKSIAAKNIIYSENSTSARYTVVCAVDQSTLDITSEYAFLDFSTGVYVSESKIFLTHEYTPDENEGYARETEINCLSYAEGKLEYVNKATVPGFVLNQYSMDVYGGKLRVVTEVKSTKASEEYTGASLYCIDLNTFDICASFEKFAPDGEKVFSVRFDGETAYVCTALAFMEKFMDPVFAIDLSDLNNITCKDTGTITGYSMSLIKFKYDTLLGIGYGDGRDRLKIELYRENGEGVESVASFEKLCSFSQKFKAYFIDAENGLIGLGINDYDERSEFKFILVLFDGYNLSVAESVKYENYCNYDYTRAALADGYIYVFSEYGVNVINWNAQ